MPSVYNGIGTWYYGKRRIQGRKSVCESCNCIGNLQSYDTTEFFVVFFVPIIPLGAKRVIDECPSCQKHRVSKLSEWEKAKSQSFAELTEELQQRPNDRDVVIKALAMPVAYQDEQLFEQVVATLPDSSRRDAEIQAQVGHGCVYFGRYAEAEEAFRASLAVKNDPEIREALAMVLLRLDRPDDAEPLVRHVFDERLPDKAWLAYFLAEGYQATGRHEEALAVMDRRDQTFPDLVNDKECKKQRKLSERHRSSGKRIPSAYLSTSRSTGYKDGNWTAALPKLIFPILIVVGLAAYLYAAWSIGNARKVYLVNGLGKNYKIKLNGQDWAMGQGHVLVHVPEGETTVEIVDPAVPLEPARFRIETPFWSRPFSSRTLVINPDRQAVVAEETMIYSKNPKPSPEPIVKYGDILYEFRGIDYEFGEFPQTLKTKSSELTKKRVTTYPAGDTTRFMQAITLKDEQQRMAALKTWLALEPNSTLALQGLTFANEKQALEILRAGLDARPLRVDWHRGYQTLVEHIDPTHDLVAEYRKLQANSKGDPNVTYLLARCMDGEESDKLMMSAAEAKPPSRYAFQSLGFRDLSQAKYTEAAEWFAKALEIAKDDASVKHLHREALLGAGRYDDYIRSLNTDGTSEVDQVYDRLRVYAAKKDDEQARIAIDNAVKSHQGTPADKEEFRKSLQTSWAMNRGDVPAYLASLAAQPNKAPEILLLEGKLSEAAAAEATRHRDVRIRGLIYLAAVKAKDQAQADKAFDGLLKALSGQDRHERLAGEILAGRKPFQWPEVQRLPIDAGDKRVLMAVMATKFPDHTAELLKLAKSLDIQRDAASMCLTKFMPVMK